MLLKWSEGNYNDKMSPVWFCRTFTDWITFKRPFKEKSLIISFNCSLFGNVKKLYSEFHKCTRLKGKKNRTNLRKCGATDVEWPVTVYKYNQFFISHLMLPSTVLRKSWKSHDFRSVLYWLIHWVSLFKYQLLYHSDQGNCTFKRKIIKHSFGTHDVQIDG